MTVVDLGKHPTDDEDEPGGQLEVRPDGEVADRWAGEVEQWWAPRPTLYTRARQVTARRAVWLVDQPVVVRGRAVGRQLPRAGGRLLTYTPRGVGRTVRGLHGWLVDAETLALLAHHAEQRQGPEYEKVMHARAAKNLGGRKWLVGVFAGVLIVWALALWAPDAFAGLLALAVFVGVAVLAPRRTLSELGQGVLVAGAAGGGAYWVGPWVATLAPRPHLPGWAWVLLGVLAVVVFGWVGRRPDTPLVDMPPRAVPATVLPITAPMVIAALVALDKKQMKEPDTIRVLMDPHRVGDGVQLDLELPGSVTAADIIEDREALAAAMRRELGTVWPSVGPRHPGHLSMFISRVPMATAVQAAWPIAGGGAISLFQPQPLFTDQRGQWVYQALAYTAWIIGAVPRMGKTMALLVLGLIAAFDPRVKLYVFDLKGTGDLSALAKVAHAYRVGDEPEDIAEMLTIMRGIRQEMRERTRRIRELTLEENPERGKVTDALARRDPDAFGIKVVIVDEVQVWNQEYTEALPDDMYDDKLPKDPGKAVREEFIAIQRDLVKRGPALGIIPALATQKPDAKSIPSAIADNASARLCLKVNGQISNDQILGTSSYQAGIRATQFGFSEKGIAYFRGDGAEPLIVRTVTMSPEQADKLADRARALRINAGLLTGEAADDSILDAEVVVDIVLDVETVMRRHERGRAHHVELVAWLQALRPELYAGLSVDELSARLRKRDVPTGQLKIDGRNRKGVYLSDVADQGKPSDDGDDANADT